MGSIATKLVIFEIEQGDFTQGFTINARIRVRHQSEQVLTGRLPAAEDLQSLYDRWQASYHALGNSTLISVSSTQVTNLSIIGDCTLLSEALKTRFNQWLNDDSMRRLERQLLLAVGPAPRVRFMVQTSDRYLRRLPWQTWDLLETHYPNAEVMLSHPMTPPSAALHAPVRILAVEGNTQGTAAALQLEQLKQLPQTDLKILLQPTNSELIDRLWHEDWDMFFFLGHSDSALDDKTGEIQISATETISLGEIHHALQNALKNGLKLAVFNSCNGLGLAQKLADLNIPYVIVMRERVPDQVAQEFFKTFLNTFSQGKLLHEALHTARKKLEGYGDRYPCAHWLPVLCQNPNAPELRYPKAKPISRFAIAGAIVAAFSFSLVFGIEIIRQSREYRDRTSMGERQLDIAVGSNRKKTAGLEAYAKGEFVLAQQQFDQSLQQQADDPETRIYLNNARAAQKNQRIRLVVSVPLRTSPYVAREILRGVAQRQEEFNKRIDQGRSLEILIGSDDNNEEITKNLASHWAKDRDTILAVIGHNAGNASLPAAAIYEEFKLPMISPTTYVELPSENRYTFRMQPSTFKVADMLVGYANQTFAKQTIAGCVDKESKDNSDFEKHFKEQAYGAKFTYLEGKCNIDGNNTEQKIRTLKEQGVTVIVIAPFVNKLDRAFEIANTAQKANLKILGTPSFYLQPTLSHPDAMQGLAMPVAWMPYLPEKSDSSHLPSAIKTSENTAFYRKALTLWKLPTAAYSPAITWRTAMAYDATYVLTEAIDHLEKTDRSTIQMFIQNIAAKGATGEITFDSSGTRKKPKEGVMVSVQRRNKTKTPQVEFLPIAPPQK